MAIWKCRARIIEYAEVSIEADSAEDATKKFENLIEWLDGWDESSEIVDWEIDLPFVQDEPAE